MADIILENTVPDAFVTEVTDAFIAVGGASFRLEIDKHNSDPELDHRSEWSMVIPEQDVGGGENLKQYGERILRSLGLMVVRAYDKWLDEKDRYRPAIAAIDPPEQDVDDGAIV